MKAIYTDSDFEKSKKQTTHPEAHFAGAASIGVFKASDKEIDSDDTLGNLPVAITPTPDPNEQYIIHIGNSKDFALKRITKKMMNHHNIFFDVCFDHNCNINQTLLEERVACFINYIQQNIEKDNSLVISILFRGVFNIAFNTIIESLSNNSIEILIKSKIINSTSITKTQFKFI